MIAYVNYLLVITCIKLLPMPIACDKGGQTRGQHTKHLVTPTSFQELLKAGLGLGTGNMCA